MGEAKRRIYLDELVKGATKIFVDQGRLIEAGWVGLRAAAIPKEAPPIQVAEMRMAFFAGAQHLLGAIGSIMDEDREPTEADLKVMDQIHKELAEFASELELRLAKAKGQA